MCKNYMIYEKRKSFYLICQLVVRLSSLETRHEELEQNLDQLFLVIMGSIVFLMQVSQSPYSPY